MNLTLRLFLIAFSTSSLASTLTNEAKCMKKSLAMGLIAEDAYQICSVSNDNVKNCVLNKQSINAKKYSGKQLANIGSKTLLNCQK